jgi:hypothetical protein
MSIDHLWIGYLLTEEDHARVLPRFEVARLLAAPAHAIHVAAIEAWKANPEKFEDRQENWGKQAGEAIDAFIWAFCLPGYDALMKAFTNKGGGLDDLSREDVVVRFTMTATFPPVAVLWHALGFERASALPGDRGNLLVHPRDVPRVLEEVTAAYRGLDIAVAVARAHNFCRSRVHSRENVEEVVTFLPDGLGRAAELGKGFCAVAHRAP